MYKLYAFYGFKESQIAVLYVAGFASRLGPQPPPDLPPQRCVWYLHRPTRRPLGQEEDGKSLGPAPNLMPPQAIAFSVIYTFCCLTKMSPNFWWLLVGRVFGGISTSMLFSTFESWSVPLPPPPPDHRQVRVRALRAPRLPLRVDRHHLLHHNLLERNDRNLRRDHLQHDGRVHGLRARGSFRGGAAAIGALWTPGGKFPLNCSNMFY